MKKSHRSPVPNVVYMITMVVLCTFAAFPTAAAKGYGDALKGVKGMKAVFDYSQSEPKMSNIIFGALKGVYEDEAVTTLPEKRSLLSFSRVPPSNSSPRTAPTSRKRSLPNSTNSTKWSGS